MDKQENIQVQQQSQQQINIGLSSFLKKNNIILGKKLCEGYFAEVFEGFDINLNRKVAIKRFKDLTNLKKFEDEKNAMQKIQNHQYAVQIIKYLSDIELGYSMIVMEFCDCTLAEIFEKNSQNFTFEQLVTLTYQLLKGLLVFQEKGIIHGDLNPENILYNQQKNMFLISDLGLSQIIENPELQQLISKQSKLQNDGNLKYKSPEVIHNIRPFTIKIDIFSIGQILLEFLLKRELTFSEFLKLKEFYLLKIIPGLKQHQNYEFVEKILEKMVCPECDERQESMKLLQKLNAFQLDEESLKSLLFSSKNDQKINTDSSQQKLPINTDVELYQQLVTLQNNEIVIKKNNSKNSQNLQLGIQLSNINLVEKKQLKSIWLTNGNMDENLNLKNFQEVKLDFRNSLKKKYNCFGSLNIVNAIEKIQNIEGISNVIVYLEKNNMSFDEAQSIANSLMKCQNLSSLKINVDQNYFDGVDINNIICFLRVHSLFSSFELQANNQENSFNFMKDHDLIQFSLELRQLIFDESIHRQRISTIKSIIQNQNLQTRLDIFMSSKSIDNEKAQTIATSLKHYQNTSQLRLDLRKKKGQRIFLTLQKNIKVLHTSFLICWMFRLELMELRVQRTLFKIIKTLLLLVLVYRKKCIIQNSICGIVRLVLKTLKKLPTPSIIIKIFNHFLLNSTII